MEKIDCSSCGSSNPEGSSFCNRCGKPVSSSVGDDKSKAPEEQPLTIPSFLQGIVIFRPKEKMVRLWAGSRHTFIIMDGREQSIIESGYVVVTNQRVLFITERGLFNKSYTATEVISLESIGGISVKPGFINDLLMISYGEKGYVGSLILSGIAVLESEASKEDRTVSLTDYRSLTGQMPVDLQTVDDLLSDLVQQRLQDIEKEKRRERVQFVLDFSFLKAEMEKGGLIIQTIKCPACGAGVTLPLAGSTTQCPYCGSTVHAQDVFEKMRGLISSM